MMGMASPTGYLDLEQPAVTGATEVGTATVDGVAVTQYELAVDPTSLATAPGTSSEEQSAIEAAIATLTTQGYRTIHDLVSIDASGFIRESTSTVTFADGGTVTLDAHFSNFGCAGTVLMPGQGGISTPPTGCSLGRHRFGTDDDDLDDHTSSTPDRADHDRPDDHRPRHAVVALHDDEHVHACWSHDHLDDVVAVHHDDDDDHDQYRLTMTSAD